MVNTDKLIERLKTQIKVADRLQSDWVYITKEQALKCLELAEAQDVIMEMLDDKKGDTTT